MIESSSCLINGYRDTDGNHAMASINRCMSGCGAKIQLVNMGDCGVYWLCRRKDDPRNDYILLLPSAKWEQDAKDDGFEPIQKLNQRTP